MTVARLSAAQYLVALVLILVLSPVVEDLRDGDLIEAVFITLVLISGALALGPSRTTLIASTALALPAIVGKWVNHFRPDLLPARSFLLPALAFGTFIVARQLRFLWRAREVDSQTLCAGISGYLTLGLVWAFAYAALADFVPHAFASSIGVLTARDMSGCEALYFSFVTLTTTGYGDITPIANSARMLAAAEAVTGTFYIAILISRLVALHASGVDGTR